MATSKEFLLGLVNNPNIQACLKTIRHTEGTSAPDGYLYLFGSTPHNAVRFTDTSKHPNIDQVHNGISSTAAGMIQLLHKTYAYLCEKYALDGNFDESGQQLLFVALLDDINVLMAVANGRMLEPAIMKKLGGQWASLPGSPYGQPVHSLADVTAFYQAAGGTVSAVASATA